MPLGLWKSKWEIHREDMDRYRADMQRHDQESERRDAEHRKEAERRDAEHRQESERRHAEHRQESERRDAEHRQEAERRDAEYRGELREQRLRSDRIAEETRDLRADYERELSETRLFNRELLIRMEKTYANLNSSLVYVGEELSELKAAVRAQTDAIMRLVDLFEDPERRPPV